MLLKIVCMLTCRVLGLAVLLCRGDRAKDAELLVLRHENAVLRRHAGRARYELADRAWLAALARVIPRRRCSEVLPVTPATLLAWHRKLAASKYDTSGRRKPGRPPKSPAITRLVVRLAKENPLWGYRRVHGELTKPGIAVAPSTAWKILHAAGIDPAPRRAGPTWRQFLYAQAAGILAADFLHADTVLLKRLYESWCSSSTVPAGCIWAASPRTPRASGPCSRRSPGCWPTARCRWWPGSAWGAAGARATRHAARRAPCPAG